MPNRRRTYNCKDDALCSRIIHSILNKGLSYVDISERYGYPYQTIKSTNKGFEENNQLLSKHRGDAHRPILQDEHTQLLVKRLHIDPDIAVESLHRQVNEVFQFPHLVSISHFLNVVEWAFGYIKSHVRRNNLQNHQASFLDVNDDKQEITTNLVQGWMREVNRNLVELLAESD